MLAKIVGTSNTVTAVIPIALFQHSRSHVLKLTAFSEHLSMDMHNDRSKHSGTPVLEILQNGFMHTSKQIHYNTSKTMHIYLKKNILTSKELVERLKTTREL